MCRNKKKKKKKKGVATAPYDNALLIRKGVKTRSIKRSSSIS